MITLVCQYRPIASIAYVLCKINRGEVTVEFDRWVEVNTGNGISTETFL